MAVGTKWSEAPPGREGTSQVCDALGFGYVLVAAACPCAGSLPPQGPCYCPVLGQVTSASSGTSMLKLSAGEATDTEFWLKKSGFLYFILKGETSR